MLRVILALGGAALAFALVVNAAPAATKAPTLTGTVGPGYTIKLTQNGKAVKTLKAGSYTLVVHDKANVHNFVVEGPGVERDVTTVPFVGTKTVTVKLRKGGKYKFYCRPHESSMFGYVTVT